MLKKVLSSLAAILMLCTLFASCGESEPAQGSEITVGESQSSSETSSKKPVNRDEYVVSSETKSEAIKVYKNPQNVMLGCFHFNPGWCYAYGSDYTSRLEEFRDVVKEGYFNTYMLGCNEYLLDCAKIVAEYGGTIWIGAGRFNSNNGTKTMDGNIENLKAYFNVLKKNGLYDLVNGFYWDEPIWCGQSNADFLTQTSAYYKTFGLRNFPVFACGEFSDSEGNELQLGVTADKMRKVTREACKYVTDVAYDSYSVDVREGASNGNKYAQWSKDYNTNIYDGKSYYSEIKKYLQRHVGHPANIWYYPTAYATYLWGGLGGEMYASEDYCIAMLEFMAEDILKEKYPGGLIIYNYHKFKEEGPKAFEELCDVKNEAGHYKMYPDTTDKWDDYCNALRNTTKKFNLAKGNLAKLDV